MVTLDSSVIKLDKEVKVMKAQLDEQAMYDGQLQVTHCTHPEITKLTIPMCRFDCTAGVILRSQVSEARVASLANTR